MLTNQKIKKTIMLSLMGIGVGMFVFTGCKNSGMTNFATTPNGLQYKIIEDVSGDTAKPGDYMKLSMRTTVHDSTLMDTYKEGPGYRWIPLQESMGQKFDPMEGLLRLSKGDSAEFMVPADSVMNPMNRPPFVKEGDMIHMYVKVFDIKDKASYEDEQTKEKEAQTKTDSEIIKKYVDSVGGEVKKSDDGVYAVIHKDGQGAVPENGQTVSLMYTGKTLDGETFDSNMDTSFHHTDPLMFAVGQGRMIPGMESGIKLLSKGAKATLVIPSGLAYGINGRPPVIPPNAVLLFDVDVKDITESPASTAPQGQPMPPQGR